MSQTAYLVSCEILCGEGSDGALEGMDSAYVIVGVYAANDEEAMTKVEASLEEEGYGLVEADWIAPAARMTSRCASARDFTPFRSKTTPVARLPSNSTR